MSIALLAAGKSDAQTGGGPADIFEPDDSRATASLHLGSIQEHTFHETNDVDWVRFYAITGYTYKVSLSQVGANVDVMMTLYREEPDGSLAFIQSANSYGPGSSEQIDLSPSNTCYHVLEVAPYTGGVSPAPPGSGQTTRELSVSETQPEQEFDNGYAVEIEVQALPDTIIVAVFDWLTVAPVTGTVVVTFSSSVQTVQKLLDGKGSVYFVIDPNIESFTIGVTAESRFKPNQDPLAADQVSNPENTDYGNPRTFNAPKHRGGTMSTAFAFTPHVPVTGSTADKWTGQPIEGAQPEFTVRGERPAHVPETYDRYPMTSYTTAWRSNPDGSFPSNTLLPALDWDLVVGHEDYHAGHWTNVVSGSTGSTSPVNMDIKLLEPLDQDDNGLADYWEAIYFPGGGATTNTDHDADGHTDYQEMLTGTNPTNTASVLKLVDIWTVAGLEHLRWPVTPGRRYRVAAWADVDRSADAPVYYGTWRAEANQTHMVWQVPHTNLTRRFFRIELVPTTAD